MHAESLKHPDHSNVGLTLGYYLIDPFHALPFATDVRPRQRRCHGFDSTSYDRPAHTPLPLTPPGCQT